MPYHSSGHSMCAVSIGVSGLVSLRQNGVADLPQDVCCHCLVTLANGDLFYSGGYSGATVKTSYRYVKQEDRWDQKANMVGARRVHGCGSVTNPATGKEEVVVTGGGGNGGHLSSTEIYNVEDDTWRQGTPLPKALNGPTSLPYEDSFLILGGYDGSCLDSIYQVETPKSFYLRVW